MFTVLIVESWRFTHRRRLFILVFEAPTNIESRIDRYPRLCRTVSRDRFQGFYALLTSIQSSIVGDSVFITASPQDIALIQKLDNFSFAGAILSIRAVDPPAKQTEEVSEETAKVKEQFKQVLYKRYNADTKCLDLSALSTDAGLQQMGAFEAQNPHKIFPAMMAICDSLFENRQAKRTAIVSVLLTDNGLADVNVVTALANSFPDIKNIDLSRNNLADLKSLDAWRTRFRDLEVLILAGNPIEGQLSSLQPEIMKRYPRLHMLNNVVVRSPEQIAATIAEAARLPFPVSGPQFNDVEGVGATFVTTFLALYDTNRQALLTEYYDSNSTYSLAINMTAPRSTKVSVPVQPWAEYTKYSRNLNKINHLGARMNRRFKGVQAIQPVWANLPATQHPNLHTNANKYMIECQSTSGLPDLTGQAVGGVNGLTITIHGEFEDNTPNTTDKSLRSFSRTFVLGPGAPGGPQIRVVSDMLALRAWGPLPEPTTPPAAQPTMTPEGAELEQKKAIATQLMEKTGMTLEYSGMCLNAVEWDLQKAYDMFISNKVSITLPA